MEVVVDKAEKFLVCISRLGDHVREQEASKHVVNKQQTSRFAVIILIYDKNRLQNSRENCSQTYKQPIKT